MPSPSAEQVTNVAPADLTHWLNQADPRSSLTFDDGYADNLLNALPLLERHDRAATIFVTTGFIEATRVPSSWLATRVALVGHRGDAPVAALTDQPPDATAVFQQIEQRLRAMTVADTQSWHERIMTYYGWTATGLTQHFLDLDQLITLDAHPLVTIGAHTVTHPDLRFATDAELESELVGGRRRLASWLGHEIHDLAYPYGATDGRVRRAAAAAGYRRAYVTETPNWRSRVPFYRRLDLPRIDLAGEVRRMHRRARKHAVART